MMSMVLSAECRGDCLWVAEVEEGGDGVGGASMVRVRLMGRQSGDYTKRVGAVRIHAAFPVFLHACDRE
jgi:hypothetical protein